MRFREIWSQWTPQVKGRDLKKQMEAQGIPILDIDLEYGRPAGAQVRSAPRRSFMEMLESRAS